MDKWSINKSLNCIFVYDGDKQIVAFWNINHTKEDIDNANHIIKCVNSYEPMRELLKDLYPEFDSGQIAQHSAKADRMRNKLELRIKQILKESE